MRERRSGDRLKKPVEASLQTRILAVVVRYKTPVEDSATMGSLAATFDDHPEILNQVAVLLWDNSPSPLEHARLPFAFDYQHSPENIGVSGAYNSALRIAEARGIPWLLLLDQDTSLPPDFLRVMLECSRSQEANPAVSAIVPFLFDGERPISPIAIGYAGHRPVQPPFTGIYPRNVFAANSGTLMRVSALRDVGGYDERFWLDLSDVVAFHRLWAAGYRTFIAGGLHVQHKVTNNDYDGSMSPQRYENFISAEGAYWDLYRTRTQNLIQTARLFARTLRQYRRYKNKVFSRITWRFFCERLLTRPSARLAHWRDISQHRNLPNISKGEVLG